MILCIFVFTYVTDIESSIKRKNNINVVKYEWESYILYMFKNNIKNCALIIIEHLCTNIIFMQLQAPLHEHLI